jgi:hypothetical protein
MAVAAVLVWSAVHGWGGGGLLSLLPALLLGCALHARCYPGERLLIALRHARRAPWPHPRSSEHSRRRVVRVAAHGGLLIGCSLAVRPPPSLAAAS